MDNDRVTGATCRACLALVGALLDEGAGALATGLILEDSTGLVWHIAVSQYAKEGRLNYSPWCDPNQDTTAQVRRLHAHMCVCVRHVNSTLTSLFRATHLSSEHGREEHKAWSVRRVHAMGRTADRPREQQRVDTTRKKTRGIRRGLGHRGSLEGRGVELSRGGGRPRVVDAKTRHRRDKQRVRNKLN